jgi:hypothetical protein
MEEEEAQSADLKRLCQGVSPNDEPCDLEATLHCETCGRWLCPGHAEGEEWHVCMLLVRLRPVHDTMPSHSLRP